jgi:hypothetical protein
MWTFFFLCGSNTCRPELRTSGKRHFRISRPLDLSRLNSWSGPALANLRQSLELALSFLRIHISTPDLFEIRATMSDEEYIPDIGDEATRPAKRFKA